MTTVLIYRRITALCGFLVHSVIGKGSVGNTSMAPVIPPEFLPGTCQFGSSTVVGVTWNGEREPVVTE